MATELEFELDFRGQRYKQAVTGLLAFASRTGRSLETAAPVLAQTMRWYLNNVATAMGKRHGGPWPGGTSPNTLSRRSGALMSSIKNSVRVDGTTLSDIRGQIGAPGLPYGRVQEFGATIVPVRAKYLAIPLPAAMDSNGIALKPSPRDWDRTFIATSKAGNLIIFRREGKSITPLYVLKLSVTIPPRLGLGDTIRTGMNLFQDRAMSQMLKAMKAAQ